MHTLKFFRLSDFNLALAVVETPPLHVNHETLEMSFGDKQWLNDAINDLKTAQLWDVPSFKGPASWALA